MTIKPFLAISLLLGLSNSSTVFSAEGPHWTYADQTQLLNGWGAIEDSHASAPLNYPYAECALGHTQTPIDLNQPITAVNVNRLSFRWPSFHADFFNTGHAIQVQPNDDYYGKNGIPAYSGQTRIGHDSYPLLQAHFHSPSEHWINGKNYAGELHFVHARADGHLAVVGVLMEIGKPHAELEKILLNMPDTPDVATHNPTLQRIDPNRFRPEGAHLKIYSYSGSLTTPPCTEGVSWYIYEKPISVSYLQLQRLRAFYADNNRQLQAERSIQQFKN